MDLLCDRCWLERGAVGLAIRRWRLKRRDAVSAVGGVIGAMHIPEKWFPGSVDIYLNSHNIMHVLVVMAVYSMHQATIRDIEWMQNSECSPSNLTSSLNIDAINASHLELWPAGTEYSVPPQEAAPAAAGFGGCNSSSSAFLAFITNNSSNSKNTTRTCAATGSINGSNGVASGSAVVTNRSSSSSTRNRTDGWWTLVEFVRLHVIPSSSQRYDFVAGSPSSSSELNDFDDGSFRWISRIFADGGQR